MAELRDTNNGLEFGIFFSHEMTSIQALACEIVYSRFTSSPSVCFQQSQHGLCGEFGFSERISRENQVVPFCVGLVAGEIGFMLRFVDGFTVDEPAKAPGEDTC